MEEYIHLSLAKKCIRLCAICFPRGGGGGVCVCVCVFVCVYLCVCICVCACVCAYMHVCVRACVRACIRAYVSLKVCITQVILLKVHKCKFTSEDQFCNGDVYVCFMSI